MNGQAVFCYEPPINAEAVFRYEVPVDDRVHGHHLSGRIVHVACRRSGVVEFWALTGEQKPAMHYFRVYGTGQVLPDGGITYVGTALYGNLVWHLFHGIRQQLELPGR